MYSNQYSDFLKQMFSCKQSSQLLKQVAQNFFGACQIGHLYLHALHLEKQKISLTTEEHLT